MKRLVCCVLVCIGVCVGETVSVWGQDPPRPARAEAALGGSSLGPQRGTSSVSAPTELPKKKHKIDRKFWTVWIPAIVLQFADAGMTSYCVRQPNCAEANPLFGKKPSDLKLYSVKVATVGLFLYFSHSLRRDERSATWLWPPAVLIATGTPTVIHNGLVLSSLGSTSKAQPTNQTLSTNPSLSAFARTHQVFSAGHSSLLLIQRSQRLDWCCNQPFSEAVRNLRPSNARPVNRVTWSGAE